jgi:release factor glutamine methyltransferase
MTVGTALRQGRQHLEEGGIAVPRLSAEVLLCHALGCERSYLYAHPERELRQTEGLRFEECLHERLHGKPTQYITERQEFYGRPFRVTPAVMIPRPETEHVVETALEVGRDARSVVDVGCGSGAIAVTLQLETGAEAWGADISAAALCVAAGNARRLGADVRFVQCDLASAIAGGSADLLLSNPPYVPRSEEDSLQREVRDYEPHLALFGGDSGLDFYGRLIREGTRVLRPGGWLIVELGIRQLEAVKQMLAACWRQTRVTDDLAGLPRVLAARYEP